MNNNETKNKILDATKELLLNEPNPEKITARKISTKADVNLAMINYCFHSKDQLLKTAVNEIINGEFENFSAENLCELTPLQKLKKVLCHISEVTLKYEKLTRLSIPYDLLNGPIEIPYSIMPYIKEITKGKKDEQFCKVIAFQLVSTLQLVFYRADDFYKYSGINIHNKNEMNKFIDSQVNLLLGGE